MSAAAEDSKESPETSHRRCEMPALTAASDCEAGCIDRPDCRYFSHSHVSEDCRFCGDCARTIAGGANMYTSWWKVDAGQACSLPYPYP